ncbi:cytochrome c [Chitinophaga horti]|uniref:Cytochrome c n=1 Tax=Chitinophaga horti TaxID=2920382 RepID=A0ABY6IWY4_9BACT|nr:cytochrome c [Chitinophaga horti]UYQ91890.1 cytochrome c [Chitinophaga horti]
MKDNIRYFLLLLCLGLGVTVYAAPPSQEEGALIFKARCAACHNVNKKVLGPPLAKVYDRRSMEWITKFVQSSQSLIKSGDKDAVAIYAEFNNTTMPDHPDITPAQVESIVAYIKSQEVAADPNSGGFKPESRMPAYRPLQITDYGYITGFVAVVLLLILVMLIAVRVKDVEREMKEKS